MLPDGLLEVFRFVKHLAETFGKLVPTGVLQVSFRAAKQSFYNTSELGVQSRHWVAPYYPLNGKKHYGTNFIRQRYDGRSL